MTLLYRSFRKIIKKRKLSHQDDDYDKEKYSANDAKAKVDDFHVT